MIDQTLRRIAIAKAVTQAALMAADEKKSMPNLLLLGSAEYEELKAYMRAQKKDLYVDHGEGQREEVYNDMKVVVVSRQNYLAVAYTEQEVA